LSSLSLSSSSPLSSSKINPPFSLSELLKIYIIRSSILCLQDLNQLSHLRRQKKISNIWFIGSPVTLQNPLAPGYRTLLSLHAGDQGNKNGFAAERLWFLMGIE